LYKRLKKYSIKGVDIAVNQAGWANDFLGVTGFGFLGRQPGGSSNVHTVIP
jgi:hypothetical protein